MLTLLDPRKLSRHGVAVIDGVAPRIDQQRTACRATGKQERDKRSKGNTRGYPLVPGMIYRCT